MFTSQSTDSSPAAGVLKRGASMVKTPRDTDTGNDTSVCRLFSRSSLIVTAELSFFLSQCFSVEHVRLLVESKDNGNGRDCTLISRRLQRCLRQINKFLLNGSPLKYTWACRPSKAYMWGTLITQTTRIQHSFPSFLVKNLKCISQCLNRSFQLISPFTGQETTTLSAH